MSGIQGQVPGTSNTNGVGVTLDGEIIGRGSSANEQPGSAHDSQMRIQADYKSIRVTVIATDVTIFDGPCRIGSIVNEAAVPAVITLKDNGTAIMTVTMAANSVLDSIRGQRFPDRLQVNTTAQPLAVQYREAIFEL